MKHTFLSRAFALLLAALLTSALAVPAAFAADDESVYASQTADDIRVSPPEANTDGLLKFDEKVRNSEKSIRDLLNDACKKLSDGHELEYISYIALSPNEGTLYDGYTAEGDPGAGVAGLRRYYYDDKANSNYKIGDIQFVPAANFTGDARISYYGYYKYTTTDTANVVTEHVGNFSGSIYIGVAKQVPGISYSTDGEAIRFSAEDFATYSLATTGRTFRYVSFTLPDESEGKLYYNYRDESIYDNEVTVGARYYRSDSPNVGNVYFVPNPDYSGGTVRLAFELINMAGKSPDPGVDSIVNITVTAYGPQHVQTGTATNAFTYEVSPGESQNINNTQAFIDLCRTELGSEFTFSHVRFMDLPASSEGTLYYGSGTTLVTTTTNYYASDDYSYLLSRVRFVPHYSFEGTVTVPFRGYGTRSGTTRYFDGTLTFLVSGKNGSPLRYTVAPGKTVYFERSDFVAAAQADMREYSLGRVRFDSLPPSSAGTLRYLSGSSVSNVSTGTEYTTGNLSNLHFAASAGFTGSVTVPFTGYANSYTSSNGRTFSGTVTISSTVAEETPGTVTSPIGSSATTLLYRTTGAAVTLDRDLNYNSILSVASEALPGAPATFSLTRPDPEAGRLCLDFVSLSNYAPFESALSHPVADAPYVSFLPKAGFSGTTRISYTVSDAKGNSFTGNIQITVTPPTRSTYFNDMDGSAWAVPAVDFFRSYGAVYGNSRAGFGPTMDMRRGDFILLLSRAFSFPNAGTASFADVPADKYYAAAIASAKSLGLLTGSASENFYPEDGISRQDAAVYLYRALRRVQTVAPGTAADLTAYRDAADVSPYAVEAMGALVRLGVFQGDYGRLYPQSTLNRAETMKILYYALT